MSTILFTEQENGNLKLVAEVDIDNPALAVDALLDESPRLKEREFMALVGTSDEGVFTRVVVEDDEPVHPRRAIRVTGSVNGSGAVAEKPAPRRRGRPPKAESQAATAEAPKRRGRPPGSKNKTTAAGKIDGRTKEGRAARAAAAGTAEAPAPKRRGRPPGSGKKTAVKAGKGASPFKRNAASDE